MCPAKAFAHGFGQTEPALDHLFLRVMTAIGQLQSQFDRTVRRAPACKSCTRLLPDSKLICPARAPYNRIGSGVSKRKSYKARSIVLCGFRLIDRDHNLGVNRTNQVNALRMRGVQPMFKTDPNGANTSHVARRFISCAVMRCAMRSFSSSSSRSKVTGTVLPTLSVARR